ncbi:MAG TPA: class I SAM-dependent methyltransferase [Polyangiales bacterium]
MNQPSGSFKDHFSTLASSYARYRPSYPDALFDALAELGPTTELAWDCATGNGQAALALARRFTHVVATDASAAQLSAAEAHPRVEYRAERAEQSTLASGSVSLVTVAQAIHWFDLDAFVTEVRRVCRPRGVLAAWTYGLGKALLPHHADELERALQRFYGETVGPYWPPERRLVEAGYATLQLPFERITLPSFAMQASWSLPDLLGYLRTWSAVKRYTQALGHDPVEPLAEELVALWGDPEQAHRVQWPLTMLAARV